MSSTLTCPFCSTETSSEYNFCIFCNQQTRCLNPECGKHLVPGKSFCFTCSQPISKTSTLQTQQNKYVRDVEQTGKNYKEHTEFTFSDHAVSEIAPFIAGQIISRPQRLSSPGTLNQSVPLQQPIVSLNDVLPEAEVPQLPEAIERQPLDSHQAGAAKYFERDSEHLVATVKDFKGSTWAEQQKRFILLYASAYHRFFGQPVPDKEHFKKAAERASILDSSNFTRYLGEAIRTYLNEIGGGFKLNQDGEKEVKIILARIENDNVSAGTKYWERNTTSNTKRHRVSKEDKLRLEEWAKEEVDLGSLKVRDIKSARDYALVSLWLLTIKLRKANAIRWNDAYYYFKEKFTTISVEAISFSRAISKPINEKYFRKTGDLYFLSSEGHQKVEGWLAGKPIDSSDGFEEDGGN